MDPITQQVVLATAGAAAAGEATYVDDVFSTFLYEGTGAAKTITNGIDLSGEGGLVWIKQRNESRNHSLYDTERGVLKQLVSNASQAQGGASGNDLDAFNSDGFSLGTDTFSIVNKSGGDYVSWSFRKTPGFFDVVTYTGNNYTTTAIPHSLGSVPGLIIVKRLDAAANWQVYHRSTGNAQSGILSGTNAFASTQAWGNTSPTSTHFYVGNSSFVNGSSSMSYVAYLFAHDEQLFGTDSDESIIKCGSYTGNGQASGTAVNLGFEPQWVMIKASSSSGNWVMQNTMTGMSFNSSGNGVTVGNGLYANTLGAESGYSPNILATSTGFEARNFSSYTNANGVTYVYMAIRRPNKPPEDGTDVFAIDTSDATSPSPPQFTSGFVTDFIIRKTMDGANAQIGSRLQGTNYMSPYSTSTESTATALTWDFMDGWSK